MLQLKKNPEKSDPENVPCFANKILLAFSHQPAFRPCNTPSTQNENESLHVVHVQYLYNTAQCVAAYQDQLPYFAVHWAWLVSQYIAVSFASFLKNIFGATVLAQDHSKLFSKKKSTLYSARTIGKVGTTMCYAVS